MKLRNATAIVRMMRAMPLAATLLFALGLVLSVRWLRSAWSALRRVRDARQTTVAQLSPGLVRLRGTAGALREPLRTPVGAVPCVFYEIRTVTSGVGVGSQLAQRPPQRTRRSIPMELTDATGTCTVLLVGADLQVRGSSAGVILPEDALAPIESIGGVHTLPRGLQYEQRWLAAGATVEALASSEESSRVLTALQVVEGSLLERARRRVAIAAMVAGTLLTATLISLAASLRAVH